MKIPVISGVIERRILVNFHADPKVVEAILPAPFRPQVVNGRAIVGICLIRLANVRPTFWPARLGLRSENAAHRFAVEWDEDGVVKRGVFIPRRDTNCRLNSLVGGRVFPGIHYHAKFDVHETADCFDIRVQSDDGETGILVRARRATRLPVSSVFESLEEISSFFERGSLGYSLASGAARLQGLALRCQTWQVEPLNVEELRSSFFDNRQLFPPGTIEFDSALLMRGIQHQWHARPDLDCAAATCSPVQS